MSYYQNLKTKLLCSVFILFSSILVGGTTGKITGKVTDLQTNEPMIGCNIIVEGMSIGAATTLDGTYFILNVPPGRYTLKASMIGYGSVQMNDLQVIVDLTAKADFFLSSKVIEGE